MASPHHPLGGTTLKLWLEPPGADAAQIHSENTLFSVTESQAVTQVLWTWVTEGLRY